MKEKERVGECIFLWRKVYYNVGTFVSKVRRRSKSCPNYEKNLVWVCASCNSRKKNRGLYEYYTLLSVQLNIMFLELQKESM